MTTGTTAAKSKQRTLVRGRSPPGVRTSVWGEIERGTTCSQTHLLTSPNPRTGVTWSSPKVRARSPLHVTNCAWGRIVRWISWTNLVTPPRRSSGPSIAKVLAKDPPASTGTSRKCVRRMSWPHLMTPTSTPHGASEAKVLTKNRPAAPTGAPRETGIIWADQTSSLSRSSGTSGVEVLTKNPPAIPTGASREITSRGSDPMTATGHSTGAWEFLNKELPEIPTGASRQITRGRLKVLTSAQYGPKQLDSAAYLHSKNTFNKKSENMEIKVCMFVCVELSFEWK